MLSLWRTRAKSGANLHFPNFCLPSREVFSELSFYKFHIYCKQLRTVLLVTANTTTFLKKMWVRITASQYTLKKSECYLVKISKTTRKWWALIAQLLYNQVTLHTCKCRNTQGLCACICTCTHVHVCTYTNRLCTVSDLASPLSFLTTTTIH